MSSSVKKIVSLAVAGAFAIGAAGALVPAADRDEYRQDGDEKKYKKRMKEEQKRHDKAMEDIRHDYDSHARHSHH